MNEVLRQERKFLINQIQYYRMSRKLEQVMISDAHNQGEGYIIRSLYFDSLDDRDYQEKEDGVELRRKIRLRNYGAGSNFAKLEMKQKQGSNQKKRSLKLSREDAQRLTRGDYSPLLSVPGNFASECYAVMNIHCYRPKSVVEYRRKAFIAKENSIRVTFDHHIIATEANFDIFDPALVQNPVFDPGLVVMEVKYNHFLLSYIKDLVNEVNEFELSVGKYALSRSVSKHYNF
ncbi:MAG: polyphosphate polymerase domain-containing protein [Coriobacteriales bacterium]|nr:polyphosphate polymerase domain-containing protein [Coriobacteriales bacterium]